MPVKTIFYILPRADYFAFGHCARVSHALGVANGLSANSFNITVISDKHILDFKEEFADNIHLNGIDYNPILNIPYLSKLLWIIKLIINAKKLIKVHSPSIVIIRYAISNSFLFLYLIKKFPDISWIYEVNSLAFHYRLLPFDFLNKFILLCEKNIIKRAKLLYVVSNQIKHDIEGTCKSGSLPKILVIPNAASKSRLRNAILTPDSKFVYNSNEEYIIKFIYFGGIYEYYDFKTIGDAFLKLQSTNPNIEFHIYGTGPYLKKLKLELPLNKNILIHGKFEYLNEIKFSPRGLNNILLLPYRERRGKPIRSPLKLYEYMSLGLPILATKEGQIPLILSHKKTGILYDADALNSLLTNMLEIINDIHLRKTVATNVFTEFLEKHTWKKRMQQFSQYLNI